MVRAKVCGLTRVGDVRAAVDAGADAVGVVVDIDVDSPREVTPARAADLLAEVPPFVTGVAVTMPDDAAEAVALAERVGADALQVHDLASDECRTARREFDGGVVAATDTEGVGDYATAVDALLVDTPTPAGGGGTGRTHDWAATRAATADLAVPVVLAGGLTPGNVTEAVETVRPFAVDVASGVEFTDDEARGEGAAGGAKDHDSVRAFVARAQEAP